MHVLYFFYKIHFLLKEQQFDIDPLDHHGNTPLVSAAAANLIDNMQILIHYGADIYTNETYRAFITAANSRRVEALQYLLDISRNDRECYIHNSELLQAGLSDGEVLEMLLKTGMNPDIPLKNGGTLLFLAAGSGYLDKLNILLRFGADPCKKDKQGRFAKDYAFDWDGRNREAFEACKNRLIHVMKGKCL